MAVLTDIGIDDCVSSVGVDCQVRAVILAVFTEEAAGTADLSLGSAVVFRGACNHFLSLVRYDGDKVLRTCKCTIFAAYALVGINLGNSVLNGDSVVTANLCALTAAEAAGVAKVESLEIKLGSFITGGDSQLL